MDEIPPEMAVDDVIAELCANLSADDPSAAKDRRTALGDELALGEAIFNRDNWLAANAAPPWHCGAKKGP